MRYSVCLCPIKRTTGLYFHLGRYIVGYTVGNFVLRRRVSGAVKHDFRPYIRRYTSPNENFEYGYPHSNVLFNFYTSKPLYFVQNVSFVSDVNQYIDQSLATLLLTSGFRRYIAGYCRKFLTLSNQTLRYIHKCIRMVNIMLPCILVITVESFLGGTGSSSQSLVPLLS